MLHSTHVGARGYLSWFFSSSIRISRDRTHVIRLHNGFTPEPSLNFLSFYNLMLCLECLSIGFIFGSYFVLRLRMAPS